jgi:hypothetical protein
MKRLTLLLALAALGAMALAQGMMGRGYPPVGPVAGGPVPLAWAGSPHAKLMGSYEKLELEALRSDLAGKSLGELGGGEVLGWVDRLSIARQKDRWLASSMVASMMLPGRGQFMNGDTAGGSLFAAAHLATVAGSLVAWYYVLPSNLRFDQLNYYSSSLATIKTAWESNSLQGYLPSIGVLAGGMALDMVWRVWSAHGALAEAKAGIDAGRVELQPWAGPLGMGMRLRF